MRRRITSRLSGVKISATRLLVGRMRRASGLMLITLWWNIARGSQINFDVKFRAKSGRFSTVLFRIVVYYIGWRAEQIGVSVHLYRNLIFFKVDAKVVSVRIFDIERQTDRSRWQQDANAKYRLFCTRFYSSILHCGCITSFYLQRKQINLFLFSRLSYLR